MTNDPDDRFPIFRLAELYLEKDKMLILLEFGISMRQARKALNLHQISSDIITYRKRVEEIYGKKED